MKANGDREIVGVVRAVRVGGPEADLRPEIFTPASRTQGFGATMFLKTSGAAGEHRAGVRQIVRDVLPTVIVPQPETMETMYGRLIAQRRFNMIVLALFGGLAIVIAAVGIYGVMTYLVTQRTQEIGIRMALGAKPAQVVRMVLGRAAILMLAGTALGVIGGWMLSQVRRNRSCSRLSRTTSSFTQPRPPSCWPPASSPPSCRPDGRRESTRWKCSGNDGSPVVTRRHLSLPVVTCLYNSDPQS